MSLPAVRTLGLPLAAAAFAALCAPADRTRAADFVYPGEYRVTGSARATVTIVNSGRRNGRYRNAGPRSKDTLSLFDTGTYSFARATADDPFGSGTWAATNLGILPNITLAPDSAALDRFVASVTASLARARLVPRSGVTGAVDLALGSVEFRPRSSGHDRASGVESISMTLRDGGGQVIADIGARARFHGRRIVP